MYCMVLLSNSALCSFGEEIVIERERSSQIDFIFNAQTTTALS